MIDEEGESEALRDTGTLKRGKSIPRRTGWAAVKAAFSVGSEGSSPESEKRAGHEDDGSSGGMFATIFSGEGSHTPGSGSEEEENQVALEKEEEEEDGIGWLGDMQRLFGGGSSPEEEEPVRVLEDVEEGSRNRSSSTVEKDRGELGAEAHRRYRLEHVAHPPLLRGVAHRMGTVLSEEERRNFRLGPFLEAAGLLVHTKLLEENGLEGLDALYSLTELHLKEAGMEPMGHRIRLIRAINEHEAEAVRQESLSAIEAMKSSVGKNNPKSTTAQPRRSSDKVHASGTTRLEALALPDQVLDELESEAGPDWLRCPITMEIMMDPVVAADGHTYEREPMLKWLKNSCRSPVTNQALPNKTLITNHAMRSQIAAIMDAHAPPD